MNALSLLVCWTLLGQVGSPLGSNTTAPLGASLNNGAFSGSNLNGSSLGGAPATPLGSTPQVGSPSFSGNAGFNSSNSGFNSAAGALSSALDQNAESDGKNYGWQINKYGELEYLIQVSPTMLRDMQDPVNKSELESRIPKELVGRIKRVVVSIGNEVLPRTPSLIEVERMIPVTASLPPGKLQDLEGGNIVHVNNTTPDNSFQSFNQSQPNNLSQPSATAPLGSFVDQTRGNLGFNPSTAAQGATAAQGSLLDRFQSSGTGISSSRIPAATGTAGTGRLGNATASGYASNQGYPNNNSYTNAQDPNSLQTGTGYGSQNTYNNAGNYAPLRNDGYGRLASNQSATGSGFGNTYNQYGTSAQDDPRRWASAGSDYQGFAGASNYVASAAPQRSDLPSTSVPTDRNLNPQSQRAVTPYRDAQTTAPNYLNQAYANQENNYFFYVFFILSIAVNLWMVHLLRSLYMRYRNLLTSLRSQSSTTIG